VNTPRLTRPWLEPPPAAELHGAWTGQVSAEFGLQPLVAHLLLQRGIARLEDARPYIDPWRFPPPAPPPLPGLEAAAARLEAAIQRRETIAVWGDFDVDGQTSTTLLVSALQDLGARVIYHIPVRAAESHGVNLPNLERLLAQGAGLVLTCDTGISARQEVEFAAARGVDFVITDHHDLPPQLPAACAVLNPRLAPAGHPSATLPGVGVAYKLAEELYRRAGRPQAAHALLDLVALGIVADLALLRDEARWLLQQGLTVLRATPRLGLQAMMEYASLNPASLSETHIGFVLAPRLNALGRLSDANPAVELLTTLEPARARRLALELENWNAQRRLLTNQVFKAALSQLEANPALLDAPVLLLSNPAWPAGVVGIVASRLVELFHRPVVLVSSPPGEPARASARSVEGIHITAAIAAQADLLLGYGGHPMAAGFSLPAGRLDEFRVRLAHTVGQMSAGLPNPGGFPLAIDAWVPLKQADLALVEQLERLAPFGPGSPSPVLAAQGLRLKNAVTLGKEDEHLLLTLDEGGAAFRVVWWQGAGAPLPQGPLDLAYMARAANFRGERQVELELVDLRPSQISQIDLELPGINLVDFRQAADPPAALRAFLQDGPAQVWREGPGAGNQAGGTRLELQPAGRLVIWTIPPGQAELDAVLARVRPLQVACFALQPVDDRFEALIHLLAGMVKFALQQNQGQVHLGRLAAACAQRQVVVRRGIEYLAARGWIELVLDGQDEITVRQGGQAVPATAGRLAAQLSALLEETSAYRDYFRRADLETLLNRDILR
jgi:single-stranded-DNA-specific exonuclease